MFMGVKSNLKLMFSYLKLNIKKEWKYKTSFFMQIFMMILNDLFFIIQWYIIFKFVDNIGGYGFKETMLLWAVGAGGYGVSHLFFHGAWDIKDIVYDGKLDVYLTQPKNVLLNVACSKTDISAIGDILYAFVILIIIGANWWWYLLLPFAIIMAGLIYFGVYVTFISLCFHIKAGDAVASNVESAIMHSSNYPPAIFNVVIKTILFTVIPVFFYTFIPVQYLFLTPNIWWILGSVGATIFWVCLAFLSFHFGLKKYNSGNLMGGRL